MDEHEILHTLCNPPWCWTPLEVLATPLNTLMMALGKPGPKEVLTADQVKELLDERRR